MKILIDGTVVDVLDDDALYQFCILRAESMIARTRDYESKLDNAYALATFAALKMGALCAAIAANPSTIVERDDLYAIAELMGDAVDLNLRFQEVEVQRVEGKDFAVVGEGGSAAAGGGGGRDAGDSAVGGASEGDRPVGSVGSGPAEAGDAAEDRLPAN